MKIRFLEDHTPKGSSASIPTYEAGKVYDFKDPVAETYARKYILRGLAVQIAPPSRKPKPKD